VVWQVAGAPIAKYIFATALSFAFGPRGPSTALQPTIRAGVQSITQTIRTRNPPPPPPPPRPDPILNPPVPYEPPPNQPPPWNPGPINRGPDVPLPGRGGIPVVGVIDLMTILEQLKKWNDLLTGGIYTGVFGPLPDSKGPPGRGPVTSAPGRAPPGRGDPFPPGGSPPQVIIIREQPPAPRETAAEARERKRAEAGVGLEDIYVDPRRLPVPATPPATVPRWQQLLGLGLPLLGPLLGFGSEPTLSQSQEQSQPRPEPDLGYQPEVANYFGGNFGGGAVGTNTCECKPPRKKRRKKKRTKCYTGRFTEGLTGISKYSKREVPCK